MPLRIFLIVKDRCRNLVYVQNRGKSNLSTTQHVVNAVNLFFDKIQVSGDDRARTDNLRLARAALSQLSYVPEEEKYSLVADVPNLSVDVGGLEPPTSALSELRSNQLIYTSSACFRAVETGGAFWQSN